MINREPVPIRSNRSDRRWPTIIAIVVIGALVTGRFFATLWTDYLWYQSVDQTGVWRTLVFTRVGLVIVASALAFGLFWLNLWLVDKLSPRRRVPSGTPEEELLARFQEWIEPRVSKVRFAISAFFGIMLGLGGSVWWQEWLLFRNGTSFGVSDPIFENDLSLYVFQLPFYNVLFGWFFQLVLVIAVVSASIHYLNGAVEFSFNRRVEPGVKVHLSVLFASLAVLKAAGYLLNRWELLFSARGQVFGASYTDVNAQLPALNLLILISLVAAAILLLNLRFRGWTLPIVALSLWLGTSVLVGGLYPTLVQRFSVVPDEVNKEEEFVGYNIDATLGAYGLEDIGVTSFAASDDLDREILGQNQATVDNIRLWDPGVLTTTYKQLQNIKTYYDITDVDVDRYEIDGELTQVMVSARELDEANVPGGGWVNEKLVYTHGFGPVLSPANSVTAEGQPEFLVQDIPPVTASPDLATSQDRIYFGDSATGAFAIVGSKQDEVDFPVSTEGSDVEYNTYDGTGGVDLGGIFRRAAFALRYADLDTLISGQVASDSKVLMERNIVDRVLRLAPFLYTDSDPYLILTDDGRLVWMIDMYTVTANYPYAQAADTRRL
ncbi:MAG: COG1615 family transporter, partial [bacterium]|nr:COG1615 family transporter [bacterium]